MDSNRDSDLAKDRWIEEEWRNFELWEKLEQKQRRRTRAWIFGTVVLFVLLSAVPVLIVRGPQWRGAYLSKDLALLLSSLKRDAALDHAAYRVRFLGDGSLDYVVEKIVDCHSSKAKVVRSGSLSSKPWVEEYRLLSPNEGKDLNIPGLVETFCYDSVDGAVDSVTGFGLMPVKDLTDGRTDRISVLLVRGVNADLKF